MAKKKLTVGKLIGWALLAALALFLAYIFIPTPYQKRNFGRLEGLDLEATLAVQQGGGEQSPLENVEISKIDIPYITKEDSVDVRKVQLYMPTDAVKPVPVVYVPHYEMKEDAAEVRAWTSRGWAVAAPTDLPPDSNIMYGNDLVFNNAALYTLRHMEEIDNQHIMLVGGSAGGYMTYMLDVLQMGITASVANVPIANYHYNLYQHFLVNVGKANHFWKLRSSVRTLGGLIFSKGENKLISMLKGSFELPIPWVGLMTGSFTPDQLHDPMDYAWWEAFSPVALTDCFSSPFLSNHNTSDMLVPLNQTDAEHLAPRGKTLPRGFSLDMDRSIPGPLGHTLVEELPEDLTLVSVVPNHDPDADVVSVFDENFMFNLNIIDNGPVEAYGDHSSGPAGKGVLDYITYMETMMAKGLAGTERLMPGKIRLLLERYQGKAVQLPAHEGIDDSVYGSLAVYRKEVAEELATYARNHSLEELDEAVLGAIADDPSYAATWQEIKRSF